MKRFSKVLALVLALVMVAAFAAACSDNKDNGSGSGGSGSNTVAGEEQTWGEITVLVPDDMRLEGGNGSFDPNDTKTLWLYDKENSTKYIIVKVLGSEEEAQSNVDTNKSMNDEYSPADVSVDANGTTWKGIAYDASVLRCVTLFASVNGKTFYTLSAGYDEKDASGNLVAVINSVK